MQKKSEAPEAPEVRKENGIGKSIGRLVRAVVFLALALFLIICSNNVLRQVKYRLQKGAFPSFYAQEKNSIDIVTIGSSADYRYIDTPMLYELFGYTSYNLATAQQPTSVTRFIMNEAEKSQNPSLFIVEAREFVHLPESKQETAVYCVSDSMDLSLNKWLMLCRGYASWEDRLNGFFDITVYPAVTAWGFTTGEYRVPSDSELKTLADHIDYTAVKLTDNVVNIPDSGMLDLGAVAKGYAADGSIELLNNSKAQAAVLNLGGTIGLFGKKPDGSRFKVGIADPENPAGYFGYLSCDSGVVATSGGYERYFERDGKRYIHILDPATAKPVDNHIASVTIVTDNGAKADAMSTALFVMGLDKATDYYRTHDGFDCVILTDDGSLYISEGIYDDFTLDSGHRYTVNRINKP